MRNFILLLLVTSIVCVCIYPPWQRTFTQGNAKHRVSIEYGFLWGRPESANTIDYGRLLIQVGCLGLIYVCIRCPRWIFRRNPKNPQTDASFAQDNLTPHPKGKLLKKSLLFLSALIIGSLAVYTFYLYHELEAANEKASGFQDTIVSLSRKINSQKSTPIEPRLPAAPSPRLAFLQSIGQGDPAPVAQNKAAQVMPAATDRGLEMLRALKAGKPMQVAENKVAQDRQGQSMPTPDIMIPDSNSMSIESENEAAGTIDLLPLPENNMHSHEKETTQKTQGAWVSSDNHNVIKPDGYGLGVHINRYGQAVRLVPDGGGFNGEHLEIKTDGYGMGVHVDQYGRAVREEPW